MRVLFVFLGVLLATAVLLPASAHATTVVRVQMTTGRPDYNPVSGAEVEIVDQNGKLLGTGVTDAKGAARIEIEVPEGVDRAAIGVVTRGEAGATAYKWIDLREPAPSGSLLYLFKPDIDYNGVAALPILIRRAIEQCDKAGYDRWVAELDRLVAQLEQDLATQQAAADNFARDNNLRSTDARGARKDLDRAAKAQAKIQDASLRNPAMLQTLEAYAELLEDLETTKRYLDAGRKARADVPPFPKDCKKKDEVGMAPGNCPDGAGGGLLAGAINDVFGTDLAAGCPDPSQRRDTERPKKDRDREHDRRD